MSSKVIDDMMRGRQIVLERNGLDVSKIDSMTSESELLSYIETCGNKTEKNSKYLYSVASKRFMPETSEGGMLFKAFYDTAPQTTGDAAEVALQLMGIGRGHSVKREVKTAITGSNKYDIFGSPEELCLKHRDSDLVVTHEDGSTVHIESKVGLTRGAKKKYDLRQECLGDVYRLEKDPNTKQQYIIFRNANNGLSQLDDRDYVKNLYQMKKQYGDRVQVNYEGKYLSENELLLLSQRKRNIEIQSCLNKDSLKLNGETCSVNRPAINNSADETVRSVNRCNGIAAKGEQIANVANIHGKTSNFSSAYGLKPTPISSFASNFKQGAIQGAKYGAISGGIDAIYDIMMDEKPKAEIVADVIKKTAVSAIRSGIVRGVSNLAKSAIGKRLAGTGAGIIMDSAKSFVGFCRGKMGVKDLVGSVIKSAVYSRVSFIKSPIRSFVSSAASIGISSAGATIGGTSRIASSLCGLLKGFCGAFLGGALLSLIFDCFGDAVEIDFPNDPRVTTFIEVDERGYCSINSSMDDNLIEKLINYNDKLSRIEQKTGELKLKQAILSNYEKFQLEKTIGEFQKDVELLENQILRQADRAALGGSKNYHRNLRASVESYVERRMTLIKNQNIKLNELKEMEQRLLDEKQCCEHISKCCDRIVRLGKSDMIKHEKVKELVANITEDVSGNPVSFTTNNYTTGTDILVGCLVGA